MNQDHHHQMIGYTPIRLHEVHPSSLQQLGKRNGKAIASLTETSNFFGLLLSDDLVPAFLYFSIHTGHAFQTI